MRGQGYGRKTHRCMEGSPEFARARRPVEPGRSPRYNSSAMPKWQDVLKNSVSKETIKASNLRRIPQLKACPFWDRAIFMGKISYKSPVANYDGGIVKYDGRIYYVNRSQM